MKKLIAQVGVILFIFQMLAVIYEPFLFSLGGQFLLFFYFFVQSGVVLLIVAALLPTSPKDEWGSIWPLAGYDNAIDAIYTRGPWWVRFDELREQERQRGVTEGMNTLFGERPGGSNPPKSLEAWPNSAGEA